MNSNIIAMPVVIPMLVGIITIFFYKSLKWQKIVAGLGATINLIIAFVILQETYLNGMIVLPVGAFPAPFSIVLAADVFGAIMVVLAAIVAFVTLYYSFLTIDKGRESHFYYTLFALQIMGINGAFMTGDIFNLFVFFEILLLSSYALLVLGGEPYQLQEGFKYIILNMISGVVFLIAVAVLYSVVGTLNMADIAVKVAEAPEKGLLTAVGMTFLVVFGMKGALFPMYFWLPRSYFAPPAAIAALFGALLTKVGIYATIRVFTLIFNYDAGFTHYMILLLAGFTMFLGVLGALSQMDFKRILAYHIISQVGYMVMGLGIFTPWAMVGAIFYIIHHILVKSGLFLTAGVASEVLGTTDLRKLGGMAKTNPALAWIFLILGLSLAGVPPFSGFFSKLVLIQAGMEVERWGIVFVSLIVSFLTLFSMMKIWRFAFWGTTPEGVTPLRGKAYWKLLPPAAILMVLTIVIGLNAQFFLKYITVAADQLMNPQIYIKAVLSI
ncbi:MAG: Na+/H+ antiporter subunit D [Bacillota bacterium]